MTHCTAVNRNTSVRLLSPIKIRLAAAWGYMDVCCCGFVVSPLICLKLSLQLWFLSQEKMEDPMQLDFWVLAP